MGSLRVNGSTSGYVDVVAPAVAGTNTATLSTATGTIPVLGSAASSGESSSLNINTKPWNMPWGYLTHSTLSAGTSITGSPATIFNISYTHINNRRLRISINFSVSLSAATNTACRVQVGGTTTCYLDLPSYNPPSYSAVCYATSTGSAQTFNVSLLYGAAPASASIAASSLAQIIIEDIGAA